MLYVYSFLHLLHAKLFLMEVFCHISLFLSYASRQTTEATCLLFLVNVSIIIIIFLILLALASFNSIYFIFLMVLLLLHLTPVTSKITPHQVDFTNVALTIAKFELTIFLLYTLGDI